MSATPNPTTFVKYEKIYFANGSIAVFSLPKDSVITVFKVHKASLSQHSVVFENMLSLLSPSNAEVYDGVPIVHLDDDANDLIAFLSTIFDFTAVPTRADFYNAVDKVDSVFKLAKKYQATAVLAYMRGLMRFIWPQDLQQWDRCILNRGIEQHRVDLSGPDNERPLDGTLPDPCSAIYFAREYDVPSILPAAFYQMVCISQRPLKTHPGQAESWRGIIPENARKLDQFHLSPEDYLHLLQGTLAIYYFIALLHETLWIPDHWCSKDSEELQLLAQTYSYRALDGEAVLDVLKQDNLVETDSLCFICAESFRRQVRNKRIEFWNCLPEFFHLEASG